jgi:hypothetical protein
VESLDQLGARIETLDLDIGHRPMRVVDDDGGRPPGERSLDRGIDVVGHHRPHELVVHPAEHELVGVGDTGNALGVGRDQDTHTLPSSPFIPLLQTLLGILDRPGEVHLRLVHDGTGRDTGLTSGAWHVGDTLA